MERSVFLEHLRVASKECVDLIQDTVTNTLPYQFLYLVLPNSSYDGNPLHVDEHLLSVGEKLPRGRMPRPRSEEEVVDMLWSEGRVPEWIDVLIRRVVAEHTIIKLSCCGRFTANEELLYYRNTKCCPFGVKGTMLPTGWTSVEAHGRFDLHRKDG